MPIPISIGSSPWPAKNVSAIGIGCGRAVRGVPGAANEVVVRLRVLASLGVSYHTVNRHLDILEQTFLVRRLQPYFRNVGKRLVRSPKVYLRDSGLLHHLLNLTTLDEVRDHPVHGPSWETFVLEDLVRRETVHPHAQFYFWRTADGAEIDLVIDRGRERVAVEIKAGRGDTTHAGRSLARAMSDADARVGWILDQAPGIDPVRPGITRRNFPQSPDWLP